MEHSAKNETVKADESITYPTFPWNKSYTARSFAVAGAVDCCFILMYIVRASGREIKQAISYYLKESPFVSIPGFFYHCLLTTKYIQAKKMMLSERKHQLSALINHKKINNSNKKLKIKI
jgi:hypothetical protein